METLASFRRPLAAVALATMGSLGLSACAESAEKILPNSPATVLEHIYDDPDTWTQAGGKLPIVRSDPEHFYLKLEQCDLTNNQLADGRGCVQHNVSVNEETYNAYEDGSQITFTE